MSSSPLCPYKNMFGAPGKGIHATRLFGIAIWDAVMTLVAAVAVAWAADFPMLPTIIAFFLTGIIAHRLFCVRTAVDKFLFP